MAASRAYAVFEGGGVKGIALVGALARVEEEGIELLGYAGASAGAIVAALAAAGYPAVDRDGRLGIDLHSIIRQTDYRRFLVESPTLEDLEAHFRAIDELRPRLTEALADAPALRWWRPIRAARLYWRLRPLLPRLMVLGSILNALTREKGLYSTSVFLRWVRDLLNVVGNADQYGNVTFGSIRADGAGPTLKVVAADLGRRQIRVYGPDTHAGVEVAEAVQASMSIPLFFRPFAEGSNFLVDGGLLSNFPAWVFDAEKHRPGGNHPVLGFRLVPEGRATPEAIDSFERFARSLYLTTLEGAGELQTRQVANLVPIRIPMPPTVWATKFNLSPSEQDDLFARGYERAADVLRDPEVRATLGLD